MEKYSLTRPKSHKTKKRVGRGMSSGSGKTSGRGHNGQLSRSGCKRRAWFEGGQMPIQRRVPKRGFNNIFKKDFQIVNITNLVKIDVTEINPEVMKEKGLIQKSDMPVKVLGSGEIASGITVIADAFSNSAKEKIEKAGGKIQIRPDSERIKKGKVEKKEA